MNDPVFNPDWLDELPFAFDEDDELTDQDLPTPPDVAYVLGFDPDEPEDDENE